MLQLTRQEQLIVAFIMSALIIGTIVRLYFQAKETKHPALTSSSSIHLHHQ